MKALKIFSRTTGVISIKFGTIQAFCNWQKGFKLISYSKATSSSLGDNFKIVKGTCIWHSSLELLGQFATELGQKDFIYGTRIAILFPPTMGDNTLLRELSLVTF